MEKSLKIFIIVLCFAAMSESWADKNAGDFSDVTSKGTLSQPMTTSLSDPAFEVGSSHPKNCTFNVEITLEDGTTVSAEITIMDISWWDCTKIKIVNFLSKVF